MAELQLSTEELAGGSALIRLAGELDLSNAEDFRDAIAHAEEDEPPVLMVDLRELAFMDSTGLRLLLSALRRAEQAERRFVVVNGQEQVRDLFRVAGLEDVFELVDDPSEAGAA